MTKKIQTPLTRETVKTLKAGESCTITGTMNVESTAADANVGSLVGVTNGTVQNMELTIDVNVTAEGAANVGGIAGLIGGLVLAIVINMCRGKSTRNQGFPLVPYLAVGFLAAYFI